jgi:GNAT superfamily N-acetyltransferase
MNITYYNGSTDAYSGQVNMEAAIYVDGEIVGAAEYVLYGDELSISDIHIKPQWRRKGMGSRLIKYIKEQNPGYTYEPSFKTEDGSKFSHKDISLYETRAKKIHEDLRFERGKDPIKSMDIGLKALRISHVKLAGQTIKDPAFIKRFLSTYVPHFAETLDENPTSAPSVTFIEANEEGRKPEYSFYYLWYNKYSGVIYDDEYYPFYPKAVVSESLDFKRGADPKQALGLGARRVLEPYRMENFATNKNLYAKERSVVIADVLDERQEDIYVISTWIFQNLDPEVKKHLKVSLLKGKSNITKTSHEGVLLQHTPYGKVVREYAGSIFVAYWTSFDTALAIGLPDAVIQDYDSKNKSFYES